MPRLKFRGRTGNEGRLGMSTKDSACLRTAKLFKVRTLHLTALLIAVLCSTLALACIRVAEAHAIVPSINYYFPWYDNVNGATWLLMGQPSNGNSNYFSSYKDGTIPLDSNLWVAPGGMSTHLYNWVGGPLKVTATDGPGLISERSLFGGSSFEEVWGTKFNDLDSHYYWPTYYTDQYFSEWVLVANPPENNQPVQADLSMNTASGPITATHVIQPGESWTPTYANVTGDAVEVKAYRVGGSPSNPADALPVIASERILIVGTFFNEMPGIPASKLSGDNLWTWYDAVNTDSGADLVCIGNPAPESSIWATIKIAGVQYASTWIQAGQVAAWSDSTKTLMGGPVEVTTCYDQACTSPAPSYTSQESLYGPSYEEIAGTPASSLLPTANWTWYDQLSAGSQNWILVANPNASSIYYEISMPGVTPGVNAGASGVIQPGQKVTPQFNGKKGGPVRVSAWTDSSKTTPANVMASQRVLWNGNFNEVVGLGM